MKTEDKNILSKLDKMDADFEKMINDIKDSYYEFRSHALYELRESTHQNKVEKQKQKPLFQKTDLLLKKGSYSDEDFKKDGTDRITVVEVIHSASTIDAQVFIDSIDEENEEYTVATAFSQTFKISFEDAHENYFFIKKENIYLI